MDRYTELKNMSLEDLASVVSAWPWFGTAQKQLCEKMVQIGGSEWGTSQYADAAMHIACRGKISTLLRRKYAYDRDEVAGIIARYLSEKRAPGHPSGVNRDFRGVGDYFSLAQYENVRQNAGIGRERLGHARVLGSGHVRPDTEPYIRPAEIGGRVFRQGCGWDYPQNAWEIRG